MKLIINTIAYFLLSFTIVFANGGGEHSTVISEADWIGPLIAVLIIILAVVIARKIKKSR